MFEWTIEGHGFELGAIKGDTGACGFQHTEKVKKYRRKVSFQCVFCFTFRSSRFWCTSVWVQILARPLTLNDLLKLPLPFLISSV